ncbi:calcium-binding protein [Phaeobacter gallaeciensis]|uniref:beta strand repeat-containing protein n=1 Tax=Phaeobacter gallaeciensis TaxID=60890 RepID=UPI0023807656|nr:calcium-binding protein [Phaeobacter gallaeciensis]MDE4276426.1 calcium-binding protein [Phaeobacter gallaeciensis]MDE4301595.1 calcium-binding protein [Phaeobacter gallaeciensis]MDE5186750.1 calcium-binding protein [Phaeobacter gallaeciensis]
MALDEVNGTLIGETLAGTNSAEHIRGFGGDDTINGVGGEDSISGGDGNDNITAGDDNDTILGGEGNDTIVAAAGNDSISGGAGDDIIDAGTGIDYVAAGAGDDEVTMTFVAPVDEVLAPTQQELDDAQAVIDGLENQLWGNGTEAMPASGSALVLLEDAETALATTVTTLETAPYSLTTGFVLADVQALVDAAATAKTDADTALAAAQATLDAAQDAQDEIEADIIALAATRGGNGDIAGSDRAIIQSIADNTSGTESAADIVFAANLLSDYDDAIDDVTDANAPIFGLTTTANNAATALTDITDLRDDFSSQTDDLATQQGIVDDLYADLTDAEQALDDLNNIVPVTGVLGSEAYGGDGTDTLIIDQLANGDVITDGQFASTVHGEAGVTVDGFEFIKMTGYGDYVLDLSANDAFASTSAINTVGVDSSNSGEIQLIGYTADTGVIAFADADVGTEATDPGIVINGTRYVVGDTLATAAGGSIEIAVANGNYSLIYSAPSDGDISVINVNSDNDDETITVAITDKAGNVVETEVALSYSFGADVNIGETVLNADDAWTNSTRIVGDAGANELISGEGNDTIIGGDGNDSITLNGGNNVSYAGAGDTGNDTVSIDGDGLNTLGTGDGADEVYINGDGANTVFLSLGGDYAEINGDGANTIWSGADDADDTIIIGDGVDDGLNDGDGNNVIGLGAGDDYAEINGDGDNVVYGAAGDDFINVNGDGDNTVYGGADATASNTINVNGEGDNTIYNGAGDDAVNVAATATGANTFYGGAGDDTFTFADGAAGTLVFEAGQGNDTVDAGLGGAALLDDDALMINLSAFGYADGDAVLADMANDTVGGQDGVLLTLSAGQTIFFDGTDLTDFQQATVSDWAIL